GPWARPGRRERFRPSPISTEGTHGWKQPRIDSEKSEIPSAGERTPLAWSDVVGGDVSHLFRFHLAGRIRAGVPRRVADRRRDDNRHRGGVAGDRGRVPAHRLLRQPRQRNLRRADTRHRQGGNEMSRALLKSLFLGLGLAPGMALAQTANAGGASAPTTDWTAIAMFAFFVAVTLGITYWAAMRTKTAAQFYAAGGGITGLQNGLAIAGDYMSAASFLGISGLVYAWGYDGLIFSVGWLVGWPIVTFLIAEPLRNLGRFTFADVASFRFEQTPVRVLAASGTLVTVAFYLVAQMVGAGALIKILFGLEYWHAVVIVGALMILYVTFGGMFATTWVQIIKAGLLLGGATLMALLVLAAFGFNPGALFAKAAEVHPLKGAIMGPIFDPDAPVSTPLSAISTGLALMF